MQSEVIDLQKEIFTINDLCELLSVTPKTVHSWRHRGIGPTSFKAGKHVRYKRSDIEAWIEQNTQESTQVV
jgi:excisionase family DNA binding protein